MKRRTFLTGGAAALGSGLLLGCTNDGDEGRSGGPENSDGGTDADGSVEAAERKLSATHAETAGRTLVVVELQGGNDGLATLSPLDGRLEAPRPRLTIDPAELMAADDEYGWAPSVAGMAARGMAGLVGIGALDTPSGSHFEMERRWWSGESSPGDRPSTGFLGRLCDQLDVGAPVTGLAIGSGVTPSLASDKAVTVALANNDIGRFLDQEDPWSANLRRGLAAMGGGDGIAGLIGSARRGLDDALHLADAIGDIDNEALQSYPGGGLARSFGVAAQLIDQEIGLRVIHIKHGGFDTHSGQSGRHAYLMGQIDEAVSAFVDDLDARGRLDTTLVATTSEFGRRVAENDGGTDHGAASVAMLLGPVNAGIHGEHPSLDKLDDGNLRASIDVEEYYATIAETWFGCPAGDILSGDRAPIEGLLTV